MAINKRIINPGFEAPLPPIPANPIGFWEFNNNLNDSSGNGNNGTPAGTITYATGKYNQAVSLITTNGIAFSSLNTFFNVKRTYSVSLWFKTTSTIAQNGVLFGSYNPANINVYLLINGGQIRNLTRYSNATTTVYSNSGSLNDNVWHNAVLTNNVSTLTQKLYIDGVLNDTVTISSNSHTGTGAETGMGSNYSVSLVDQTRLYDYVLDSDQVLALYNE